MKEKTFLVPPGASSGRTLLDVLRDAGILLPAVCGGRGTCGGCAVRLSPAAAPKAAERERLSGARLARGERLACLVRAAEGQRVVVPAREPGSRAAAVRRVRGRAPGALALAVDAGTTTVACALVSRRDGAVLAEAAAPNRQASAAGDVIARIEYAGRGPRELARLRNDLAASIRAAAAAACRAAGLPLERVAGGAVSGNPTMIHILAGADPTFLGRAPFRLAFSGGAVFPAAALGFPGAATANVAVLPLAGPTLGGDAVGGAVALGLDRGAAPRLLIDVGTNTEMVLRAPRPGGGAERVGGIGAAALAASAASGGAFEGESLSCGMRAGPGAVTSAAWEDGDIRLRVAGGGPPAGVAGSGLLDLMALLRRFGIVDPSGRMLPRSDLFGAAPPALLGRVVPERSGEPAFLVARSPGRTILLTAADVRQFQLAKGAIRAGLDVLLSEAGIPGGDVAAVHLSGAFGAGVDASVAVVTGLFPPSFRGRIVRSGNSSLMAAVEAVRTPGFLARADRFTRRLRVVSLADHPRFPALFLAAMSFPSFPE